MSDRSLMMYLGLSREEFSYLRDTLAPSQLDHYRTFDEVSPNLEQLATKMNRPPLPDALSDLALEAASAAAFARLEEAVRVNEAFRQARSNSSLRSRQLVLRGHRREMHPVDVALAELGIDPGDTDFDFVRGDKSR
jgi:hypothetical protein